MKVAMWAIVNQHVVCHSSVGLLCCAVFEVGLAACPHNEAMSHIPGNKEGATSRDN